MIKRLFLFCVGVLCAALLFEGALRLIEATPAWKTLPVAEISLYGPSEQSGYTHRPNMRGIWATENRAPISTTDFGIRANGLVNEIISDDPETIKIGLIGDSITEALQVADHKTFVALTEKKLNQQGQKYRVYNLGLAGATPAVKAARTKHYAMMLNLDIVIIIEDPSSLARTLDKSEGGSLPYYHLGEDGNVQVARPYLDSRGYRIRQSQWGNILYFVMDHSRLMTMLNNRLNRGVFAELKQQMAEAKAKPEAVAGSTGCPIEDMSILAEMNKQPIIEQVKLLTAFLKDLADIKKEGGIKIILSMYDTWSDCPSDLEEKSYAAISTLAHKNNISFFNLKKSILNHVQDDVPLNNLRGFKNLIGNGHLNENGHEIFSDALTEKIKNLK